MVNLAAFLIRLQKKYINTVYTFSTHFSCLFGHLSFCTHHSYDCYNQGYPFACASQCFLPSSAYVIPQMPMIG